MKIIIWAVTFLVFFSFIVFALTFTKEYTERVEIPRAFVGYMCLWDETSQQCIEPPQENDMIVFGNALVYGTPQTGVGPFDLNIFYFHGNLYRDTGRSVQYLQTNCRNETYEKEGRTEITEICDSDYSKKVSEMGGGSIVMETGVEIQAKSNYVIYFNEDGSFRDLIMRLRENSDETRYSITEFNITYKLYNITGFVENVTWHPQ